MWLSGEEDDPQRREEPDGESIRATDSDIEVARKFVKFVTYVEDLPATDFTKEIVEKEASVEPENKEATISDADNNLEIDPLADETSCENIGARITDDMDNSSERVVISVKNNQLVFERNATLTLPADNRVDNAEVDIADRRSNLLKNARTRSDVRTFSRETDVCATNVPMVCVAGRVEQHFSGEEKSTNDRLADKSTREGSERGVSSDYVKTNLTSRGRSGESVVSRENAVDTMSCAESGDKNADLSLEDILREKDAVKNPIRARMEVATERERALERLVKLRQFDYERFRTKRLFGNNAQIRRSEAKI